MLITTLFSTVPLALIALQIKLTKFEFLWRDSFLNQCLKLVLTPGRLLILSLFCSVWQTSQPTNLWFSLYFQWFLQTPLSCLSTRASSVFHSTFVHLLANEVFLREDIWICMFYGFLHLTGSISRSGLKYTVGTMMHFSSSYISAIGSELFV